MKGRHRQKLTSPAKLQLHKKDNKCVFDCVCVGLWASVCLRVRSDWAQLLPECFYLKKFKRKLEIFGFGFPNFF